MQSRNTVAIVHVMAGIRSVHTFDVRYLEHRRLTHVGV